MRPLHKIWLFLLMLPFVGCTERYVPNVDADREALVVEGLITNANGPFFIKLTKALPYNSDLAAKSASVADANVYIVDSEGQTFNSTHQAGGIYWLPSTFAAVTGRSYTLHIETSDGETYESDAQKLLPSNTIDTLYTKYMTKKYLDNLGVLTSVAGYEVRANLFHNVQADNPMPLCRFESEVVVQYQYTFVEIDAETQLPKEWSWYVFGWNTFQMDEHSNITDERATSSKAEIKDHLLSFVPKPAGVYGISSLPDASMIYYYRLKQYTINDDTYRFYQNANKQLLATGKIFDPIASQLTGNIRCTSNPSNIALGLFEVSSESHSSFLVRKNPLSVPYDTSIPSRREFRYKFYSDGRATDDAEFDPIPLPTWWNH